MTTVAVELDDAVAARLTRIAEAQGLDVGKLLVVTAERIDQRAERIAAIGDSIIAEYGPLLRRL